MFGYRVTKPNQDLILNKLSPLLSTHGILVTYSVGNGKTYAAAALAQLYMDYGYKVYYLSHTINSINNFLREYEKFACVDMRFVSKKHLIKTMTFIKFIKENPTQYFSGLIIIDEAHNLRENAIRYTEIDRMLKKLPLCKVMVVTATPMIDSAKEINDLRLLGTTIPYECIAGENMVNYIELKYKGIKSAEAGTVFYSKMIGKQLQKYNSYPYTHSVNGSSKLRQTSMSLDAKYDTTLPLREQSSKLYYVLEEAAKINAPKLIYTFFVKRGVDFIRQALKAHGYQEYEKGPVNDPKKRFTVVSGSNNVNAMEKINIFNNMMNQDGKQIEFFIGTNVISESISLNHIRQAHILTPFWNYGSIEQVIGRCTRIDSHVMLPHTDQKLDVYIHCALSDGRSIDREMLEIAYGKKKKIDNAFLKHPPTDLNPKIEMKLKPPPLSSMIIKSDNEYYDFTDCFYSNKQAISWCKCDIQKLKRYSLTQNKITSVILPQKIGIFLLSTAAPGHYVWRSCVDGRLRHAKIEGDHRRGKLLNNMNKSELEKIGSELQCTPHPSNIIDTLKEQNRYFDKQIWLLQ